MKKEAPKVIEKKTTLPEVLLKYEAKFSIATKTGFAHIGFEEDGEMYVEGLNDESYFQEDGNHIPFADIEIVADFMRAMKELRLAEYEKKG